MHLDRRVTASSIAALAAAAVVVWPSAPASAADATCQGLVPTIAATADGQSLTGTEGPDVISAAGFVKVRIDALGGDDVVCNEPTLPPPYQSVQTVDAGAGNDSVVAGNSVTARGGAGDDTLVGVASGAEIRGDDGSDTLRLEPEPHHGFLHAYGGAGDDVLQTNEFDGAHLTGEDGNDRLTSIGAGVKPTPGIRWEVMLDPGQGDDVVTGSAEATLSYSGTTPVTFRVADGVVEGQGHDVFTGLTTFSGSEGSDTFIGSDRHDTYLSTSHFPEAMSPDTVYGNGGSDTIELVKGEARGGGGADHLTITHATGWGGSGADDIRVEFGGTAHGGSGRDKLDGTVEVSGSISDAKTRRFVLEGNGGNDTIDTPDVFHYDGPRPQNCGTVSRCRVTARGGSGTDVLAFDRRGGRVTVDLRRGVFKSLLSRGTARAFEKIEGSSSADRIYGTQRQDHLDGKGGRDQLVGRGGRDVLHGGKGRDTAVGGPGRDRCKAEVRRSC